jgi:hypothetical protein
VLNRLDFDPFESFPPTSGGSSRAEGLVDEDHPVQELIEDRGDPESSLRDPPITKVPLSARSSMKPACFRPL